MDTPAAFLFSGGFACHGDLMRILRALRSHATLSVTAGVLTVVLVLATTGRGDAARIVATTWVGAVVVWTLVGMVRQVMARVGALAKAD